MGECNDRQRADRIVAKYESDYLEADASLFSKDYCTLLYRMLNMNRYLYWPIEEPISGRKKMQVDTTNSIKYFDWFKEVEMFWLDKETLDVTTLIPEN